ncbi:MAG: pyruvate kinase [Omnitrophica bacterium RBG_13_46_9]|nr:MAG: pyruvate kinase [Omnitrophica bacterium RBG_13_46_9]
MAKAKIIATLGPASNSETVLRKMFTGGLDIVRLNFSHGTHIEHLERARRINMLNKNMRRAVKIMQDLEGYRIRVGRLSRPLQLKKRARFHLTQEDIIGDEKAVSFDYKGSLKGIKKNTLIFIDDGKIVLEVKGIDRKSLKVKVRVGGLLTEHKGINIPTAELDFESLTQKDRQDLKLGIEHKFDYIAQSFVRDARDIRMLKNIVKPKHEQCKIFAKVESRQALADIEEIIDEADGIIVARGDLGICVPVYKVPAIQKEIVKMCRLKNKPVVVATQMLDSMTEEPFPTRAEVSDVANAILDGATHLMLSGETAVGKYPYKAVCMMNKIIKEMERYQNRLNII